MSSTDPMKNRLQDKHNDLSSPEKFWAKTREDFDKFDKDFDSLKAAIDRAIQQDPYGTLFGRQLQSPPTANNSSWISWLFNRNETTNQAPSEPSNSSSRRSIPIEILDEEVKEAAPASAPMPAPKQPLVSEAIPTPKASQAMQSTATAEYVYDPISGRKVQKKLFDIEPRPEFAKSLFDAFFLEHGAAPDKPVKQHKIHGYTSEKGNGSRKPSVDKVSESLDSKSSFGSSRRSEYYKLRAATLGNNIDTAAEYGGKYTTEQTENSDEAEPKIRKMPDSDENSPLFSGTTYAPKADKILNRNIASPTWLDREGFRAPDGRTAEVTSSTHLGSQRLQSSLDRMQSKSDNGQGKTFISKLQPAIDRVQLSRPNPSALAIPKSSIIATPTIPQSKVTAIVSSGREDTVVDKREDIDLLRASDIRAATKSVRVTKQESEDAKVQARHHLEGEFAKAHQPNLEEIISGAKELRAGSGRSSSKNESLESHPIDLSIAQNSPFDSKRSQNTAEENSMHDYSGICEDFSMDLGSLMHDVANLKTGTAQLAARIKDHSITPAAASDEMKVLTASAEVCIEALEDLHGRYDTQIKGREQDLSASSNTTGTTLNSVRSQKYVPDLRETQQDLKSVKRSLQEISANVHDFRRSNMQDVTQTSSAASVTVSKTKDQKADSTVKVAAKSDAISSPYLILVYNRTTGDIDQTPIDRLPWSPTTEKAEKANAIRIMGNLNYPAAFVTHFVELEKAGYELSSGGGDMLIFKRKDIASNAASSDTPDAVKPATRTLRNAIASEEASAQPEISETIAQPKSSPPKTAATVLEEIPTEIPLPGPAAPTAPPTIPSKKAPKPGVKVRRQEQVFSGTIPTRPGPKAQQPNRQQKESDSTRESSQKKTTIENDSQPDSSTFFSRTKKSVKRGVLGITAFGVVAYTIGVVAEGIGAQAQVEGDTTLGPRKKVVMPMGQRPGIYSTESSRD